MGAKRRKSREGSDPIISVWPFALQSTKFCQKAPAAISAWHTHTHQQATSLANRQQAWQATSLANKEAGSLNKMTKKAQEAGQDSTLTRQRSKYTSSDRPSVQFTVYSYPVYSYTRAAEAAALEQQRQQHWSSRGSSRGSSTGAAACV